MLTQNKVLFAEKQKHRLEINFTPQMTLSQYRRRFKRRKDGKKQPLKMGRGQKDFLVSPDNDCKKPRAFREWLKARVLKLDQGERV